jgi:hypothetical protein
MNNINTSDIRRDRVSITPSGYFGSSKDMIVEIEDFITVEEQKMVLDVMRSNTIWDVTESVYNENGTIIYDHTPWMDRVATSETILKIDEENNTNFMEILRDIVNRLKPIIEDFYNVSAIPTSPAIVRWPVGAMQFPHADKELHEGPDAGKENNFPWYDLGTVFYFNDDYEGGELFFPKQDLAFKPKARAVYFFPGDMNFIHGVNRITDGTRYTSPWFWTITELERNKNVK